MKLNFLTALIAIHKGYADVEIFGEKIPPYYLSVPLILFPCRVSEGTMFYIYKSAEAIEIRCGIPPE